MAGILIKPRSPASPVMVPRPARQIPDLFFLQFVKNIDKVADVFWADRPARLVFSSFGSLSCRDSIGAEFA